MSEPEFKFTTFHVQTLAVYVPLKPPKDPGGPSTGTFLEVQRTQHQDGSWCDLTVTVEVRNLTLGELEKVYTAAASAVEAFRRKYEVR